MRDLSVGFRGAKGSKAASALGQEVATNRTLVCGVILGILSAKVTAVITPKPKAAPEAA
jgi:hypothetical protein